MSYNIQDHGEALEKAASELIKFHFPFYEKVWQIYIGNKGGDKIADLPNYPDEKKRKQFAENSYTVLESFFLIDDVLKSGVLDQEISDFKTYIEFNKGFILIFSLLGRIRDTAIKASESLGYENSKFKDSMNKYYEARCVVVHGKKIPFIPDELGFLKIPFLKTSVIKGTAWDDKHSFWGDIGEMQSQYVFDKATDFFYELLAIVNNEYAVFFNLINSELKAIPTTLKFEHLQSADFPIARAVDTFSEPVDVYGFGRLNKKI